MRLLLHIGTHKTGTTAIQKFCARHRADLRHQGLWYPDYDLIGGESHYAHHHLANAISGLRTSRGQREEARRFFELIRARASGQENVLISAEPFWRHVTPPVALKDNERVGDLPVYWAQRRSFVAQVAEIVGEDAVEVVAVLRRQDLCIESMFKERIKGTGYAETFETFVESFSHRFLYFDQLSVWAEFFPQLHVLVYEDLIATGNLVQGFFNALQVPVEAGDAARDNVALSNDLIAYKLQLNGSGLDEDQLYARAEVMMEPAFQASLQLDQGSTLWPSSDAQASFLEAFSKQNIAVKHQFTSLNRPALFPEMSVKPRPAYAGLSAETARAISARLELAMRAKQ